MLTNIRICKEHKLFPENLTLLSDGSSSSKIVKLLSFKALSSGGLKILLFVFQKTQRLKPFFKK